VERSPLALHEPLVKAPPRMRSVFLASAERHTPPLARAISFLLALALLGLACFAAFYFLDYRWAWAPVFQYRALFIQGWLATLAISALAIPLSLLLGVLCALARRSPLLPLRDAVRIFVEVTRGTPLLVQIFFYWYIFGQQLSRDYRFLAGAMILAAFSGAYLSELIRAGIESVGRSQLESARAIGLTRGQTYHYVIFPQAIRQILPPLAGQCASIIKDSSLLSVLGLGEFTQAAGEVNAFTYSAFESYLPVALGYLVLTLPISLWTQRLETKARFET
jgi:polar amino acid transport system permease protein